MAAPNPNRAARYRAYFLTRAFRFLASVERAVRDADALLGMPDDFEYTDAFPLSGFDIWPDLRRMIDAAGWQMETAHDMLESCVPCRDLREHREKTR